MKRDLLTCALVISAALTAVARQKTARPLQVSSVYPHLAVFNEGDGTPCGGTVGNGIEIGIGT